MKLLITSDWHADARTLGLPRFDDIDQAARATVQAAIDNRVDAYCFLGDLCDPDAGSSVFRSVELAMSVALTLSQKGIPSIWIAGNHCVIEDGSGDTVLSPLRPLAKEDPTIKLFERPGTIAIETESEHVTLVALPLTATSHPYEPAEFVKSIVMGEANGPVIVLGHLTVPGVQPGEETTDMPRGREITFPREHFPASEKHVHLFNGHYHRQQTHELPGFRPVHIPGAPARFTFGDEQHVPGYLIVEV